MVLSQLLLLAKILAAKSQAYADSDHPILRALQERLRPAPIILNAISQIILAPKGPIPRRSQTIDFHETGACRAGPVEKGTLFWHPYLRLRMI